jgi:hypothetical protein
MAKTNKRNKKIYVAVQKVNSYYVRVLAKDKTEAEMIVRKNHEDGSFGNRFCKDKDGEMLCYLNAPNTIGVRADILGADIEKMVNFKYNW